MGTIFSRVKVSGRQLAFMVAFVALSSIAQMISPGLISVMIDDGVTNSDEQMLYILTIAMVVLAFIACGVNILGSNIAAKITASFCADLRQEVFHAVQGFSAAEIDKFGSSSLVTRSTTDVTMIQTFMSSLFRLRLMAPISAVAGIVLCVASAGQASFVLVIAIPILIVGVTLLTLAAGRHSVALRGKIDVLNQLFLEALEGVRVIRAFNKQQHEIDRFAEANAETAEVSRKSTVMSGAMHPTTNMLFGLASAGLVAVGIYFVFTGSMEVGALVSAIQYVCMILIAISLMANVISLIPDSFACMNRIAEVFKTEASIKDPDKETPAKTSRGTVEFRDVTFTYPGAEEPVFKNMSFTSGPGETTAIIGRTGCGKSSVVKLIPRLYDVTLGEVLVDGVNVKDYKQEELRDMIGYVPQKNVLFTGDIADNLNFGDESGSEEDWAEACRISCSSEFVDKKDGVYHADVSQGGTNFSGGQRQLLTIARAIVADPEIMILDKATSNVDAHTEQVIQDAMKTLMQGRTSFVIAHRLSTIRDSDVILYMENGDIKEVGNHDTLMALDGKYAALYNSQFI